MQAIGGMMAAYELWERAMVPSLMSGAGTWMGMTTMEIDRLDKIQDFFLASYAQSARILSPYCPVGGNGNDGDETQNLARENYVTKKDKKTEN